MTKTVQLVGRLGILHLKKLEHHKSIFANTTIFTKSEDNISSKAKIFQDDLTYRIKYAYDSLKEKKIYICVYISM